MKVGVIGAGIAGIGVALELAARGVEVDLHERTDRPHSKASLANEGKIHLGYTYANDTTLRTARLMISGAWTFEPILRRWLGHDPDPSWRSAPITYLVHRDSLLTPDALELRYESIADLNRAVAERPDVGYVGGEGERAPRRLSSAELDGRFGPDIIAAFDTPEVAVDTSLIGAELARRVAQEPAITLRFGSDVRSAGPDGDGATLVARTGDRTDRFEYDHVVNASWADLTRIDRTAGLLPLPGSSHRWRHVVRIAAEHAPRGLPPSSVVLGPFGDVITYGNGSVFLSWYPVGRKGMVVEADPPSAWDEGVIDGDPLGIVRPTIDAHRSVLPGLAAMSETAIAAAGVEAGIVLARGASDIDQASSDLHRRDDIGVRSIGRYHSLDSGKYTTAPLFASTLAASLD